MQGHHFSWTGYLPIWASVLYFLYELADIRLMGYRALLKDDYDVLLFVESDTVLLWRLLVRLEVG